MAMLLSVTYYVFISDVTAAVFGLFIFAAGYPLFYLLKILIRRQTKKELI
jgi:hypothetical protein